MLGCGDSDRGMQGLKQTTKGKGNPETHPMKGGRGGSQAFSLWHSAGTYKVPEQPELSHVVVKQEKLGPPSVINIESNDMSATTKAAMLLIQPKEEPARNTLVLSPQRPAAKKRVNREDDSQGGLVWGLATKVAKEGDGKQEMEKAMDVYILGAEFETTAGHEEKNELLLLAMKEAEDLDDDMKLEPPSLARC